MSMTDSTEAAEPTTEPAESDPRAARVAAIHRGFQQRVEEIKADGRFTAEGKADAINGLRDAANAEIDKLRGEHEQAVALERRTLERSLFAPPKLPLAATASDKIARDSSFRDAMDRAGRASEANPTELRTLLERAQRSGDEILARAALTVGFERADVDVLNLYIAEHGDEAEAIEQLWNHVRLDRDLNAKFRNAGRFLGISK